ncbi:MAG: hypothetical protein V4640_11440 [Verrucomicrobiota bacterium]
MKNQKVILLVGTALLAGFLAGRNIGERAGSEKTQGKNLVDEPGFGRPRERVAVADTASRGAGRVLLGEIRRSTPEQLGALMFRAIECPDPVEKELLMAECLMFMEPSNWNKLLDAFAEATGVTGRDQYGAWKSCLMRSGQVAGEQAMNHWREKGLSGLDDEPWHTIYGWASVDPSAAKQWLERCEAEGEIPSTGLYQALIAGAGLHDSKATMNLLESLPEDRRNSAAGHLVWNLTARGGLEELKPWLEYARAHAEDPQLAGLAGSLRGEIEKKFVWAATSSGRADLALQHLEFLATDAAELPPLAQRVLSGFEGAKSPQALELMEGLLGNPRFAELPEMAGLQQMALEQAMNGNPGSLDSWLKSHPNSPLRESILNFQQLNTQ